MYWIFYAFASTVFIGTYNLFLEATKEEKTFVFQENVRMQKHIYLSFILLATGIMNIMALLYYRVNNSKQMEIFYKKKTPYWKLVIPGLLISLYMCYKCGCLE